MKFKKGDRVKHKEFELTGVVEEILDLDEEGRYAMIWLEGVDEKYAFDEPDFEKVEVPKVPKALDDYVKKFPSSISKEVILFNLIGDFRDEDQEMGEELYRWIFLNKKKAIDAILEGYEVEQEPLYEVVLFKHHDSREMLMKISDLGYITEWYVENGSSWQQKLTKDEIEEASELHGVDYMKIAKRVEEGTE